LHNPECIKNILDCPKSSGNKPRKETEKMIIKVYMIPATERRSARLKAIDDRGNQVIKPLDYFYGVERQAAKLAFDLNWQHCKFIGTFATAKRSEYIFQTE
jgi:hypothetical protein